MAGINQETIGFDHSPRRVSALLLLGAWLSLLVGATPLRGDVQILVPEQGRWWFLPGIAEASAPDPTAWRELDFDDASWLDVALPIGFGGGPSVATDLSEATPPMQANYSSFFLRRPFEVHDVSLVGDLRLRHYVDDGLIAWINGVELFRLNVGAEAFVPHDGTAARGITNPTSEVPPVALVDRDRYLLNGTNVLAVQVFNRTLTHADAYLDLELFDADGPDLTPVTVAAVLPLRDGRLRHLREIHVTFTEAVEGLEASDLLIAGVPALELERLEGAAYRFTFAEPVAGKVPVTWAADHGITDAAVSRNAFEEVTWSYVLEPSRTLPRLRLSEVVAANGSGLRDEDGEHRDWFEIVNEEAESVSLESWSLTDDPDQPRKWVFPGGHFLSPGERLVVFASEKDRRWPGETLHTNFKLSIGGEYLGLYNLALPPEVVDAFEPQFPRQQIDYAYGDGPGGQRTYLDPPTPGLPNTGSIPLQGLLEEPLASVAHGFFDAAFEVELLAAAGDIRYTLDGSAPTAESSRYSEALPISETTTLRAAAFREGFVPSRPITRTYIFPDQVPSAMAAESLPPRWENLRASYDMDPELVAEPFYQERLRDSLLAIPTVSIVTDTEHLFGDTGLYQNRGATGRTSERPISFELLQPDGDEGVQVNAGVRIVGNTSRGSHKQALRIVFRTEYGPSSLVHRVFPDSPVADFSQLILRTNTQDSWTRPLGESAEGGTYIRDAFLRALQQRTGSLSLHGFFVHLYLNGMYWGVYDLHERPDSSFAAAYLGGDADDYDVIKNHEEVVDGNIDAYAELDQLKGSAVSDDATYSAVGRLIDFEHLSDYMIVNMFAPALDWPGNYFMLRDRVREVGFLLFSWDADRAFQEGVLVNRTLLHRRDGDSPTKFYHALREHPEFRRLFADRVDRHFAEGGPLSRDGAMSIFRELADGVELPLVAESARWGTYWGRLGPRPDVQWRAAVDQLQRNFLSLRSSIVVEQFREQGLFPSVRPPRFLTRERLVAPGSEVSLLPREGLLYYTLDGSDPRDPGGTVSEAAIPGGEGKPLRIVAAGNVARFRVPIDDSEGLAWTRVDFDDASWLQGTTPVGFGAVLDEEVGSDIEDFVTEESSSVYVRIPFELGATEGIPPDDISWMELSGRVDDGVIAYINGVRVAALGEPKEPRWDSSATHTVSTGPGTVPQTFRVFLEADVLQPGANVLALHGLNATSRAARANLFIDAELVGFGASAPARIGVTETTRIRARTLSSALEDGAEGGMEWSALAEASFVVDSPSALRITEILYHAHEPPPGSPYDDSDFDFLELQNTGDARLDLAGVELDQGVRFTFDPGTSLEAGEVLVLVKNIDAFALRNDVTRVPIAGEFAGRLSNAGETLRLRDALGQSIQEFTYADSWYPATDGQGASLVVVDPQAITQRWNDRDHWRASEMVGGSPGAAEGQGPATVGLQLPGDANQDARLNVADAVAILRVVVGASHVELSCGAGAEGVAGALEVIDVNADERLDLIDGLHLLNYLFLGAAEPAAGRTCTTFAGCDDVCLR